MSGSDGGSSSSSGGGTYRVPDLQLDLTVIDRDGSRAELDTDRQIVHRLESLVGEL